MFTAIWNMMTDTWCAVTNALCGNMLHVYSLMLELVRLYLKNTYAMLVILGNWTGIEHVLYNYNVESKFLTIQIQVIQARAAWKLLQGQINQVIIISNQVFVKCT